MSFIQRVLVPHLAALGGGFLAGSMISGAFYLEDRNRFHSARAKELARDAATGGLLGAGVAVGVANAFVVFRLILA